MTSRKRFALLASAVAAVMVLSLQNSRAAGEGFVDCGPFRSSASSAAPKSLVLEGGSRASKPGEIASGSESSYLERQQVVLNIRPCKGTAGELVVFRWPFRRTVVGSVNCGGSQVAIVQVEQQ